MLSHGETEHKIQDVVKLCTPEEKIFVFPEKYSLPSAISLCKYHGGYLFTPRSQEENDELLTVVNSYASKCESNGNIFWLGASTENYDLVLRDNNQNLVRGNFTNWNSPLF